MCRFPDGCMPEKSRGLFLSAGIELVILSGLGEALEFLHFPGPGGGGHALPVGMAGHFSWPQEVIETKEVAGWGITFLYKMSDNVVFCHVLGAFLAVLAVRRVVSAYSVFFSMV